MRVSTTSEQDFIKRFNDKYGKYFTYINGYPNKVIYVRCNECGEIKKRVWREIFKDRENIVCRKCGNNYRERKQICINCGGEFSTHTKQTVCNDCHIEVEKSKAKIRRRLRESKVTSNGKVDWNITLNKVIERDNNICQLCGKPCDKEDYYITEDGYFIAGKRYPSIDHIMPLSKGGTHQMSNIQLAHRCCNSSKFTKIVPPTLYNG